MNSSDLHEELIMFTPFGFSREWRTVVTCADTDLRRDLLDFLCNASQKTRQVVVAAICEGPDRSTILGVGGTINYRARHYAEYVLAVADFVVQNRGVSDGESVGLKSLVVAMQRAYDYGLDDSTPDLDHDTLTFLKGVIVCQGANLDLGIKKHKEEIAYYVTNHEALAPYTRFIIESGDMTMDGMKNLVDQKPSIPLLDGML